MSTNVAWFILGLKIASVKEEANVCRKLISIIIHVNKKAHVYAHIYTETRGSVSACLGYFHTL